MLGICDLLHHVNCEIASHSPMAILMLGASNWADMMCDMFRCPGNAGTKAFLYGSPLRLISKSKRSNLSKIQRHNLIKSVGEYRDKAGRETRRCIAYQSLRPSCHTQTLIHLTFQDNQLSNSLSHSFMLSWSIKPSKMSISFVFGV
jgi:hypothetical protein